MVSRGPVVGSEPQTIQQESGATAVEYAIMVALIAIVIFGVVAAVGTSLNASLECSASAVEELPGVAECIE